MDVVIRPWTGETTQVNLLDRIRELYRNLELHLTTGIPFNMGMDRNNPRDKKMIIKLKFIIPLIIECLENNTTMGRYGLEYAFREFIQLNQGEKTRLFGTLKKLGAYFEVGENLHWFHITPQPKAKVFFQPGKFISCDDENIIFPSGDMLSAATLEEYLAPEATIKTNLEILIIVESNAVLDAHMGGILEHIRNSAVLSISGYSGSNSKMFGKLLEKATVVHDNGIIIQNKKVAIRAWMDPQLYGNHIYINFKTGNKKNTNLNIKSLSTKAVFVPPHKFIAWRDDQIREATDRNGILDRTLLPTGFYDPMYNPTKRILHRAATIKNTHQDDYIDVMANLTILNRIPDCFGMAQHGADIEQLKFLLSHKYIFEFVHQTSIRDLRLQKDEEIDPLNRDIAQNLRDQIDQILNENNDSDDDDDSEDEFSDGGSDDDNDNDDGNLINNLNLNQSHSIDQLDSSAGISENDNMENDDSDESSQNSSTSSSNSSSSRSPPSKISRSR